MAADLNEALIQQGAGFTSAVANSGLSKYSAGPALSAITTAEQGFVIANTNDLSVRSDLASSAGVTYFQARAALDTHLAATPADAGNLRIVTLPRWPHERHARPLPFPGVDAPRHRR